MTMEPDDKWNVTGKLGWPDIHGYSGALKHRIKV